MDQHFQNQFDRVCEKLKRLLIKKQLLKDDLPHQITQQLWISNYATALNKKTLKLYNITMVISTLRIQEKDRQHGIQYKELIFKDKPQEKINLFFQQFHAIVSDHFANNPNYRCLVNCFSAKSRSPTLVLSYLIKQRKSGYNDAWSFLKQRYPMAEPNSGFIMQLKEYAMQIAKQQQLNNSKEQKQQPEPQEQPPENGDNSFHNEMQRQNGQIVREDEEKNSGEGNSGSGEESDMENQDQSQQQKNKEEDMLDNHQYHQQNDIAVNEHLQQKEMNFSNYHIDEQMKQHEANAKLEAVTEQKQNTAKGIAKKKKKKKKKRKKCKK